MHRYCACTLYKFTLYAQNSHYYSAARTPKQNSQALRIIYRGARQKGHLPKTPPRIMCM